MVIVVVINFIVPWTVLAKWCWWWLKSVKSASVLVYIASRWLLATSWREFGSPKAWTLQEWACCNGIIAWTVCCNSGRLGLTGEEMYVIPQRVTLTVSDYSRPVDVVCGVDCTVMLCQDGSLLCCGSNRSVVTKHHSADCNSFPSLVKIFAAFYWARKVVFLSIRVCTWYRPQHAADVNNMAWNCTGYTRYTCRLCIHHILQSWPNPVCICECEMSLVLPVCLQNSEHTTLTAVGTRRDWSHFTNNTCTHSTVNVWTLLLFPLLITNMCFFFLSGMHH